nr:MAG TPA: hypothetical protein [Caudoviricetes sp.]
MCSCHFYFSFSFSTSSFYNKYLSCAILHFNYLHFFTLVFCIVAIYQKMLFLKDKKESGC